MIINRNIYFFVVILFLIHSSTSSKLRETSQYYEKAYRQFVDSKEPLALLEYMDNKLCYSDFSAIINSTPKPSHIIKYGPLKLQSLDIYSYQATKFAPVIFFIHGGGSDKIQVRPALSSWLSLGYTVVSINHRYIPENKFSEQIEDCFLALKWVTDNIRNYGGNENRIAIAGLSAGAYLAAILVIEAKFHEKYNINIGKIKCWVPISGFYSAELQDNYTTPSIANYLKTIRDQAEIGVSPLKHIKGNEPPSLIIHGRDDWAVPRTNAQILHKKLKESGSVTEIHMLRGYWHSNTFMLYGTPDHLPTILINQFLAKYLPTEKNHQNIKN
jgi:acetyl esterase/lipase